MEQLIFLDKFVTIYGIKGLEDHKTEISSSQFKDDKEFLKKVNDKIPELKKYFKMSHFNLSRKKYKVDSAQLAFGVLKIALRQANVPFELKKKSNSIDMRLIPQNKILMDYIIHKNMDDINQYNDMQKNDSVLAENLIPKNIIETKEQHQIDKRIATLIHQQYKHSDLDDYLYNKMLLDDNLMKEFILKSKEGKDGVKGKVSKIFNMYEQIIEINKKKYALCTLVRNNEYISDITVHTYQKGKLSTPDRDIKILYGANLAYNYNKLKYDNGYKLNATIPVSALIYSIIYLAIEIVEDILGDDVFACVEHNQHIFIDKYRAQMNTVNIKSGLAVVHEGFGYGEPAITDELTIGYANSGSQQAKHIIIPFNGFDIWNVIGNVPFKFMVGEIEIDEIDKLTEKNAFPTYLCPFNEKMFVINEPLYKYIHFKMNIKWNKKEVAGDVVYLNKYKFSGGAMSLLNSGS